MIDPRTLGFKKGTSWSGGGPTSQDWYKNGIMIHDNRWGTIQICVGNDNGQPKYDNSTLFATVNYLTDCFKKTSEESQLTNEQAYEIALVMVDGLIKSGIDYAIAKDLSKRSNI